MFRIGFILFTVIIAHTLARHYRSVSSELTTTSGYEVENITENIAGHVTSMTIADTQRSSPSWWSDISDGVTTTYRKVTSYTGPYLLPGFLITSVIGVAITLACSYTSVCSIALSALNSNMKEIRRNLVYTLLPYISPDNLDSLTTTIQNAIDKFSNEQKNEKID